MKTAIFSTFFIVLSCAASLFAGEVSRFRGENSQGKFSEKNLLQDWPEGGPTQKWVKEGVGDGWGSVIKVGDRLYLSGLDSNDKKKEAVIALDLNGNEIWRTTTGSIWDKSYASPRTTPTYYEGKILSLTGVGELSCLDAQTGKKIWNKPLAEIYKTRFGVWGLAENVVAEDGNVFITVCGEKVAVVALKVTDGSVVWETPAFDDQCSYASPVLLDGQLIGMSGKYVFSVDKNSGKLLWKANYQETAGKPVQGGGGVNCCAPLVKGNRVFVTAGYKQGGVMYEIAPDRGSVKVVWMSNDLGNHHGNVVEVEGRIYGSNWINNGSGNWLGVDWETGKTIFDTAWKKLGKGTIVFADGRLYLYEEKRGTVGLARPGDKLDMISEFSVKFGNKEHWAHPTISDGVLYIRHGNALAAYELRMEK